MTPNKEKSTEKLSKKSQITKITQIPTTFQIGSGSSLVKKPLKDFDIYSVDSRTVFKNFYELGIELENKKHSKELPFQGNAKYFAWAKILQVLKSIYGKDITMYTKPNTSYKITYDSTTGDENKTIQNKSWFDYGSYLNFVESGFKLYGKTYTTQLTVMDNKNVAVKKPIGNHINNAEKRCFVKAVAEHLGLGLHLWEDNDYEDANTSSKDTPINKAQKLAKVKFTKAKNITDSSTTLEIPAMPKLPATKDKKENLTKVEVDDTKKQTQSKLKKTIIKRVAKKEISQTEKKAPEALNSPLKTGYQLADFELISDEVKISKPMTKQEASDEIDNILKTFSSEQATKIRTELTKFRDQYNTVTDLSILSTEATIELLNILKKVS